MRPRKRRERTLAAQHVSGRSRAQRDDDFRADRVDLAKQKRRTGIGLGRFRNAILRRTAFDDVRNVNLVAAQAHRTDHVVEQLPGATHKGQPLRVFVGAWTFSDEHEAGVWIAVAKHNRVPALVKGAAGTVADLGPDGSERGGAIRRSDGD